MEERTSHLIALCILTAALLSVLFTAYYGAVIKPGLDERDSKVSSFEPKAEIWTPELREIYANSHPLEYLEYNSPRALAINNESVNVEYIVVVVIPEGMESRASFTTHTHVKTWEDDGILVGNKTKVYKVETEMAYVFTDVNVSNNLQDRCAFFATFGIRVIEFNLTSAPFPADSTHRELQYNDDGNVTGVTEVTTIEGVSVHKVGIRTTDNNITLNSDDVSFYLTSPEIYDMEVE